MTQQKIAANLNAQSATQLCELGALHVGIDGEIWEYAKNEGGASAGHACIIDNNHDATKVTTTLAGSVGQKIGIPNIDMTDEYYGWYWRGNGDFEAILANGFTAGNQLFTSATGGVLGANGGSDCGIDGLRAIDAGVTDTRVTVHAACLMTVGVAAASD